MADSTPEQTPATHDIPPARASEMVDAGEVHLVDVRTDAEWDAGHIAGATHIEFDRLPAEAADIDRERPVLFVCRSGGRSAAATQAFRASGYNALNLDGGLLAWVEAGLPIEPDDGSVADH